MSAKRRSEVDVDLKVQTSLVEAPSKIEIVVMLLLPPSCRIQAVPSEPVAALSTAAPARPVMLVQELLLSHN